MGRYSSYPFLFDEVKSISISDLKKWNYLEEGTYKRGTITWSFRGEKTGSITVILNQDNLLTLDYKCNGTDYNYNIKLTSIPSNLGIGYVWFFICPFTHKRCRKLHLISERFMHRSNLPSGMYESQTKSKKYRLWDKVYGGFFELDNLYHQLYTKHFKKTYSGKPTKKYLQIIKKIQKAEEIPEENIERLFIK
ncbi:hypothetical protein [Aestuariivivens sediminicola]|uniref:hypothetical protein n=1 Tax=Aestuariivivens sediminicola TaxID=2913560 RepID=UPI001F578ED6|nr:hypothetical protein [Aestuariivivens sediminicola]